MDLQKKLIYNGITFTLKTPFLSSITLRLLENNIKKRIAENEGSGVPYVKEIKGQLLANLLRQTIKNIQKGYISLEYIEGAKETLAGNQFLSDGRKKVREEYKKKYGMYPPGFITISPTQKCNLRCTGCYAASHSHTVATLDYDVFKRLLTEQRDILGSHFVVISGGEPFIYNSNGKTFLDVVEEFSDMFFHVYTNGTLLTEDVVNRMAHLGNITPVISVEGYEKETDARRGKGIYKRILDSMERLRRYGVAFGVSVTATKENIDLLLDDRFYEHYFETLGATYMWIFHLMPIGRAKDTMELMLSPEERVGLYYQWERMLFEKRYFIGDFWNAGAASDGCIAYGRPGGYFYVDWNGNIMPCVFVPYYVDNIYDLYKKGKTIVDALMSELFIRGRKWQRDYGYHKKEPNNWLAPCSIRDHYDNFRKNILTEDAKPEDENAEEALKDPEYYEKLNEFDEELHKLTEPIWQQKYLSGLKQSAQSLLKNVSTTINSILKKVA